ncbi:alanine racemase [Dapis sp. BLCC M229]|uniref:alanine racemase n=1 Tax=Dapis sp. BLCC M229 TaxID=3400188 RepID=UPI003CF863D9
MPNVKDLETQQKAFDNWRSLVARFGSPLYVYDLDIVEHQVRELKQALPTNAKVFYSLKANPLPAIVKTVQTAGCCLEVCSNHELSVACNSGISIEQILYSGPGKTTEEIGQAIAIGVNHFSVESYTDLDRLEKAAETAQKSIRLLLRVNPMEPLQGGLAMSGTPSQFGFEESVLLNGAQRLSQLSSYVEIIGYHIYYGTQIDSEESLIKSFKAGIDCTERLTSQLGFTPQVIDLGGGFPWPFANQKSAIALDNLRFRLEQLLAQRKYTAEAEIWFESGRYLSASSGTLLATILDIKPGKFDSQFVVLDAGINHLGGMSGLGRIPRGYVLMYNLSSEQEAWSTETANDGRTLVVGPLCSPLDCLTRRTELPPSVKINDIVAIPNVGAYGLTASLVAFLSRPAPLEVSLRNGIPVDLSSLRTGHESLQFLLPEPENLSINITGDSIHEQYA